MTAPGLKATVTLEAGASGARLVDSASGRALALGETEAKLLAMWDGSPDAALITQKAKAAGLSIEAHQVAVLFTRLSKAGFLETTPVAPLAEAAPEPGLEHPTDIVPKLRLDLEIVKSPQSKGVMQVKDPLNQRVFTLYDFEVSIARMLDGRRTVAGVIEAAGRIGIPVTLDSLKKFIRQMAAYKFIDETVQVTGEPSTWPRRKTWDPHVRELFQSAIRLSRQGRADEALTYLDALRQVDPFNEEANGLRVRVEEQRAGGVAIDIDFDGLHGEGGAARAPAGATGGAEGTAAQDPFAGRGGAAPAAPQALESNEVVKEFFASGEFEVPAGEALGAAVAAAAPKPGGKGALVVLGLLVVTLAGAAVVMLRPVPVKVSTTCVLEPTVLGNPKAPRAGSVVALVATDGAAVKVGDTLATLDLEAVKRRIAMLEAQRDSAKAKASDKGPGAKDAKAIAKAKAKIAKAKGELAKLGAQKAKAMKNEAKNAKALAALEKAMKPKQAAVEKAEAELDAVTHEKERAEAKEQLKAFEAQVLAAKAELDQVTIVAPVAGFFQAPAGAVGLQLAADGEFGRIVDRVATLKSQGPFPEAEGAKATVELGQVKVLVKELSFPAGPSGRSLLGKVELSSAAQLATTPPLEVDLGTRPFYTTLAK